jgi:hypothetical protein
MSFEGIFRQATVYKGRNRDTAWFAAIDSEWPELEQTFTAWLAPENFDDVGLQILSLRDLPEPLASHQPGLSPDSDLLSSRLANV